MTRRQIVGRAQRGFSLLEIMVAITILGLLAAVTTVAYFEVFKGAKVNVTLQAIRNCDDALKLYLLKHNRYPDATQGVRVLFTERLSSKECKDGWGNDLHYTQSAGSYDLVSYGSDGVPGGDADAADLGLKDLP